LLDGSTTSRSGLHNWAWRFDQTSDTADAYETIECLACGVSIS
jgi:hypothetical protein